MKETLVKESKQRLKCSDTFFFPFSFHTILFPKDSFDLTRQGRAIFLVICPVILLGPADTWPSAFAFSILGEQEWGEGGIRSRGPWQTLKGYWVWPPRRTQRRWPFARGTWKGCSTGDRTCRRWRIAGACTWRRRQTPEARRRRGPRGQPAPRESITHVLLQTPRTSGVAHALALGFSSHQASQRHPPRLGRRQRLTEGDQGLSSIEEKCRQLGYSTAYAWLAVSWAKWAWFSNSILIKLGRGVWKPTLNKKHK